MAEGSSFVVSWPKNIILSFVKPLPEDLDVYCKKCGNFMQNPHQTSDRLHICEECHKKASARSSQHSAFPDGVHQDRMKALKVCCIHHEKDCEWSGKLTELSAHLNYREKKELAQRYEGCSYTEIRCRHDKCGFFYQRRKLKDHEDECKFRPATCDFCHNFENTFEEVERHQETTCPKYLVPCSNEDHQDFSVQREDLQRHLDTDCPFQPIDCQFKWAGCNDRPKRKDEDQHNATSQQKHLLLLAGTCSQLEKENKELREQLEKEKKDVREQLERENNELREQLERENNELREQLNEANQKLDRLTQTTQAHASNLERLNHTVHGDLPVTGDENNPVHVKADGQPVFFFSNDRKYKMYVIFGRRSLTGNNIVFIVFRHSHKVIPDITKVVIRSDKHEELIVLRGALLEKETWRDDYQNQYYARVPGRYNVDDIIHIIEVSQ